MKKIFQLIILTFCLQVNAQDKPKTITVTGYGKYDYTDNRGNDTLKSGQIFEVDAKKLVIKPLSQEVSLTQPLDVLVEMNGLLTVKTWNENKVKIETSIKIQGDDEMTDEQWLEKLGISARRFGNTVKVNSSIGETYSFTTFNRSMAFSFDRRKGLDQNQTVYLGNGSFLGIVKGIREVTLYVPSQSKLEIENKYGQLILANNIKDLSLINTNGQIDAADIDQLEMRSSSGHFTAGVIKNGDINISHGRIFLKELSKGVLITAYNTIEIEKIGDVQLNSASDDIDIDESGSISGIKNYGSLQINVSGNVDLEGVNSRIKLRGLSPSAGLIRIFNTNADLRFPGRDLKNYAIDVRGSFNTIYSSFVNKMTIDTLTTNEAAEIKSKKDAMPELTKNNSRNITVTGVTIASSRPVRPVDTYIGQMQTVTDGGGIKTGAAITVKNSYTTTRNFKYSYKSGDAANQTRFDITCTNCTIDFK